MFRSSGPFSKIQNGATRKEKFRKCMFCWQPQDMSDFIVPYTKHGIKYNYVHSQKHLILTQAS